MFNRPLCKQETMIKWNFLFLVLICLTFISCATLFTAQEYVLISWQRTGQHDSTLYACRQEGVVPVSSVFFINLIPIPEDECAIPTSTEQCFTIL